MRSRSYNLKRTPWHTVLGAAGLFLLAYYASQLVDHEKVKIFVEGALLAFLVHAVEKEFFWRDLRRMVGDEMRDVTSNFNEMIKNSSACGLVAVYPKRSDAVTDVVTAVNFATKRIWLLGIAFSEGIAIDLRDLLKTKLRANANLDLRILLLDPLRRPAVFRQFFGMWK